jgi:5-enolpyruvylshikimate-3-phosphate synthase
VLACFTSGVCLLTGLHTLAHKETDRLTALQNELPKLGARVERGEDWLRVFPGDKRSQPESSPFIRSYNDHRMALAFSLAAARLPEGVVLEEPAVVGKSWPGWWEALSGLGFGLAFE